MKQVVHWEIKVQSASQYWSVALLAETAGDWHRVQAVADVQLEQN